MKLFTCCWSRQKDVPPALPSVPGEVLRDFLLPLDRWTLDDVQFACRRFLRLITEHMSRVCLRQVFHALFHAQSYYLHEPHLARWYIDCDRTLGKAHVDVARLFSDFLQALRNSHVRRLTLDGLEFTPELASLVLQTPIVADHLKLRGGSCTELTPTQIHKVVLHFSPKRLFVPRYRIRACQITDELLRALSKSRARNTFFNWDVRPVDGGSFCVTDDAIVELCARQDAHIDEERDQLEELTLHSGSFTKDLFKRLVEASSVSTRTRTLRITVSQLRFEDEHLRDYAQHLSCHRDFGTRGQVRIYDFPCKQHGADTAMRMQIVLHNNTLQLTRARPGSWGFE